MAMPEGVQAGTAGSRTFRPKQNGGKRLVAESRADGNALAADRTAAAQHGSAALGFHTRTKAVSLDAAAAIRLKCALGHKSALLFPLENLRLDGKI